MRTNWNWVRFITGWSERLGIGSRRFWMRLFPKPFGDFQRIDILVVPPGYFVTGLMKLPVMAAAKRNRELVADFEAKRSWLSKPQVMWIGWLPAADQAGLRSNEFQVSFVPKTFGLGNGQNALVDFSRDQVGLRRHDRRVGGRLLFRGKWGPPI